MTCPSTPATATATNDGPAWTAEDHQGQGAGHVTCGSSDVSVWQRTVSQATESKAPVVTDKDLKGIKLRKVEVLSPSAKAQRRALQGAFATACDDDNTKHSPHPSVDVQPMVLRRTSTVGVVMTSGFAPPSKAAVTLAKSSLRKIDIMRYALYDCHPSPVTLGAGPREARRSIALQSPRRRAPG